MDIGEIFQEILTSQLGVSVWPLLAITLLLFSWWHWDKIKKLPGINALVSLLSARKGHTFILPTANPHKFSIMVARLENDVDRAQEKLILQLLREQEYIQVLSIETEFKELGSSFEKKHSTNLFLAQTLLAHSGTHILIWGSVVSHGGRSQPQLFITTPATNTQSPKQYPIQIGSNSEFKLPQLFWDDLASILKTLVHSTAQILEFESSTRFDPTLALSLIAQSKALLENRKDVSSWDPEARGNIKLILAQALYEYWERSKEEKYILESIDVLRSTFSDFTKDLLPLQWGKTKSTIGVHLKFLGYTRSDWKYLEAAEQEFNDTFSVFSKDQHSMDWAHNKVQLGIVIRHIALRKGQKLSGSGDIDLQRCLNEFEAALEIYSSQDSIKEHITTQTYVGEVLVALGEIENWKNRNSQSEKHARAISVFRKTLSLAQGPNFYRERVSLLDNLGAALLSKAEYRKYMPDMRTPYNLNERVEGFSEAVQVFREAVDLSVSISDSRHFALLAHFGHALYELGESEVGPMHKIGSKHLAESVFHLKEALKLIDPGTDSLRWGRAQTDLGLALCMLGIRTFDLNILRESFAASTLASRFYQNLEITSSMPRVELALSLAVGNIERYSKMSIFSRLFSKMLYS